MGRSEFSAARLLMKLLCLLLAVVLALMVGLTGYMMRTVPKGALASSGMAEEPVLSLLTQTGTQARVVNILLVGQDRREGEEGNRSDSMILCSFNRRDKKLVMTSFLRDLYVPIPGCGSNRINAAYAIGGTELLVRTLEENFAITVDGCVQVDFGQFSGILDRLGGVKLELRQDEAAEINRILGSSLQAGPQTLNGEQALTYARIRKLDADGDFSRTDRQRKVLGAVWDTYKDSSLPTLVRTLGSLLPMIETDMGSGELLSTAVGIFPYLAEADTVSMRIPEADYCTDRMIDGMAVLEADMETARERLHRQLYGTPDPE